MKLAKEMDEFGVTCRRLRHCVQGHTVSAEVKLASKLTNRRCTSSCRTTRHTAPQRQIQGPQVPVALLMMEVTRVHPSQNQLTRRSGVDVAAPQSQHA